MAPQLWFLRHGDAEPHGSRPDAERRLTPLGERQAMAAGAGLRRLGIEFAHVFTSPKVRALDTARIASESGLVTEPVVHDELVGLTRAEALLLAELGHADGHVLLVGHEPDFSQTVHDLTGARLQVKKGGLVGVRFGTGGARCELLVVLRPAEISQIGGISLRND